MPKPEPRSKPGAPRVWMTVFGVVVLGLIVSVVLLLQREHLPARFIDVDATTFEAITIDAAPAGAPAKGARLRLVLRHASAHGPFDHKVTAPESDGAPWTVTIRNAVMDPALIDRAEARSDGDPSRRVLEVDLPDVRHVRVLDARWGRVESVLIERSDSTSASS